MLDEKISSNKYIFETEEITNLVEDINLNFKTHEINYIDFYYKLYILKQECLKVEKNESAETIKYIIANEKGEIILRNKSFSFNSMIKNLYNIDRTQLSRGFRILERFSNFNEIKTNLKLPIKINKEFEEFSDSKLKELLPYSDNEIKEKIKAGELSPNLTVKSIRKVMCNKVEDREKVELEEFHLDRYKEYTLEELRQYTRNDLLMYFYETYMSYRKLYKQLNSLKVAKKQNPNNI